MENHRDFGPQFDPKTGTIGSIQLVKRFVVCTADGMMFAPRQGRYTHEIAARAQDVAYILEHSNPDREDCKGLNVREWWCYPTHFDPVAPVEREVQG